MSIWFYIISIIFLFLFLLNIYMRCKADDEFNRRITSLEDFNHNASVRISELEADSEELNRIIDWLRTESDNIFE